MSNFKWIEKSEIKAGQPYGIQNHPMIPLIQATFNVSSYIVRYYVGIHSFQFNYDQNTVNTHVKWQCIEICELYMAGGAYAESTPKSKNFNEHPLTKVTVQLFLFVCCSFNVQPIHWSCIKSKTKLFLHCATASINISIYIGLMIIWWIVEIKGRTVGLVWMGDRLRNWYVALVT